MSKTHPFHIAIPVHNLEECRLFYRNTLNCKEGRSSDHWVDFNLFGHQLVIHYKPKSKEELHANQKDRVEVTLACQFTEVGTIKIEFCYISS